MSILKKKKHHVISGASSLWMSLNPSRGFYVGWHKVNRHKVVCINEVETGKELVCFNCRDVVL